MVPAGGGRGRRQSNGMEADRQPLVDGQMTGEGMRLVMVAPLEMCHHFRTLGDDQARPGHAVRRGPSAWIGHNRRPFAGTCPLAAQELMTPPARHVLTITVGGETGVSSLPRSWHRSVPFSLPF